MPRFSDPIQEFIENATRTQRMIDDATRPQGMIEQALHEQRIIEQTLRPYRFIEEATCIQTMIDEATRTQRMIDEATCVHRMLQDCLLPNKILEAAMHHQRTLEGIQPSLENIGEQFCNLRGMREQFYALSSAGEQLRAFENINERLHALDAIGERYRALGILSEEYATSKIFSETPPLSNDIHKLTEELSIPKSSLIKVLYPLAVESVEFFRSYDQFRLLTPTLDHLHLSDSNLELVKSFDFLATHNISIPESPIDIARYWLDEKSEYVEEASPPVTKSNKNNIDWRGLIIRNKIGWIGIVIGMYGLLQGHMGSNHVIEALQVSQKEQKESNERLYNLLESEFTKEDVEDRAVFLSTREGEIQCVLQEDLTEPNSEDQDENDKNGKSKH